MKTTAYVTHPDCSRHDTGWAHPEHQGRLAAIARAVYRDMLTLHEPLLEMEPAAASVDDLRLAHSPAYVERVRVAAEAAGVAGAVQPFGDAGRISGASWDAATAAAGVGIAAVDAVMDEVVGNAFCAVRPPGSGVGIHGGSGFGLFNTACVAAVHLRRRRGVEGVLVLEVGAAAGWGSAEIAAAHEGVAYAGVHGPSDGSRSFPPEARVRSVASGAEGGAVIEALDGVIAEAAGDLRPGLIVLSLGLDLLDGDPLGGLAVRPREVHDLTRLVMQRAEAICGGRLVSVLEGGYDANAAGAAVVQHLRALAGLPAV